MNPIKIADFLNNDHTTCWSLLRSGV